jgi:hypothetical protein
MAVLYEDGYVTLTDTHIEIKWYYIPWRSKKISYREIASFGTAPDYGLSIFGVKTWGMAFSTVWWSLGPIGRECFMDDQLVIEIKNHKIKSGFTSKNTAKVLEILQIHCPDLRRILPTRQ